MGLQFGNCRRCSCPGTPLVAQCVDNDTDRVASLVSPTASGSVALSVRPSADARSSTAEGQTRPCCRVLAGNASPAKVRERVARQWDDIDINKEEDLS